MSVRVVLIGAGVMGADHASIISGDVPGATLHVVCDASKDTAIRIADAYSAKDVSTDPLDTIRRKDVDAVLIASPDPTHAELTLASLHQRKPVLCEKPLAQTVDEALMVLEAECALGQQLVHVGFMRRFDPSYVEMKSAMHAGRIGAAVMMHNFHRNVAAPPNFSGLMAVTNSAPHEFDIIRYVLGTNVAAISAFEPALDTDSVCKPVVMIIETTCGQLVTVEVNNNAGYGYDVRCELVGTEGSVSLQTQFQTRIDQNLSAGTVYAADWRPRFREAYRLQNKAWIASVSSGQPVAQAADAWDGYCAAVIAEAGASALTSGNKAAVKLVERPALYAKTGDAA
ncbi:Gfo/Idh/MocA family oxidoreductase [Roseibium album]|uniref:Gfo/Idh/MocA family oxidoreductase n=1 Tax=Roseibium album TaxID=311410 RepID=UPI00248F5549|nr:Gfo/Idh/MocA family oxidoreductase [Roseibium album]